MHICRIFQVWDIFSPDFQKCKFFSYLVNLNFLNVVVENRKVLADVICAIGMQGQRKL